MFQDVKNLNMEHEFNQREREPFRNLPARGSFKELESGAGSKTFKQDRRGIWLGAQKMEEAPFSVSMEGLFKLLSRLGGGVGMSADDGIWLGAEKKEDAPFSVSPAGLFKLTSSTGGGVGISADNGIWLGAENFGDAKFSVSPEGVFKMQGSGTGNKFIGIDVNKGIWLGAENFEDAPFSVDMDGNMKIKATSETAEMSMEWEDGDGNLGIFLGFKDI